MYRPARRRAQKEFSMSRVKTARVSFAGGMQFAAESGSGHSLVMDTAADDGGRNTGFSPMELPIIALAGCMGMDVVSILRKQRQDLTSYEVAVRGARAERHPQVFVEIAVEHTFTGHGLQRAAVERAVELSRTRYCSVSAMLERSAQITHTIHIHEADAVAGPGAPA
jgi:putative redox protein